MDIEFQRMKERLETIHLILDDMQVCIGHFITTSFRKMKYFSIFALSLYNQVHVINSTACFYFSRKLDKRLHSNILFAYAKVYTAIIKIKFDYRQIFWIIIFPIFLVTRSTRNVNVLHCMQVQPVPTSTALELL